MIPRGSRWEYPCFAGSFLCIADFVNILKCVAISWVFLWFGLPDLFDNNDTAFRAFGITIAALQLGVGFGAIASCVRTDRVLVLLATALSVMFLFLGWSFDEPGSLFRVLPWVVGCAIACGWFTRYRNAPPVPLARWRQPWHVIPRPRLRRLSVIEAATVVAVVGGIAIVPALHQSYHVKRELLSSVTILLLSITVLTPIGIFLGVIANALAKRPTFVRITMVVLWAFLAMPILWGYSQLMRCEVPVWAVLVLAAIVTATEIAIQTRPEEE